MRDLRGHIKDERKRGCCYILGFGGLRLSLALAFLLDHIVLGSMPTVAR
jgi:hypothetical protein